MSIDVFNNWRIYFANGPHLYRFLDKHLATLTTLLANVYRDRKRKSAPYLVRDFSLFQERPTKTKVTDPEIMFNRILVLNRLMGGEVRDMRKNDS